MQVTKTLKYKTLYTILITLGFISSCGETDKERRNLRQKNSLQSANSSNQTGEAIPKRTSNSQNTCGDMSEGEVVYRTRFLSDKVPSGSQCTGERQEKSCTDGKLVDWNGTYKHENCTVLMAKNCQSLLHGEKDERFRFHKPIVAWGGRCEAFIESRSCDNGELQRWPEQGYAACEVAAPKSCGNTTHNNEDTRIRYQKASVPFGEQCLPQTQTRKCTDGIFSSWSGSYTHAECQVEGSTSCGELANGGTENRLRYQSETVPFGSTCQPEIQTRTCNTGQLSEWSGSHSATTCRVLDPASCGTTAHGNSETRLSYEAASVSFGETCQSETQSRTCNNGQFSQWSGTFQNSSCEVLPPANCENAEHGFEEMRVMFEKLSTEFGEECKSERQTRTCHDGEFTPWTGSYTFPFCNALPPAYLPFPELDPIQPVETILPAEEQFGRPAFMASLSGSPTFSEEANTYGEIQSISWNGDTATINFFKAFASRINFFSNGNPAPARTVTDWIRPPASGLEASFLALRVTLDKNSFPEIESLKAGDYLGLFATFTASTSFQSTETAMNNGQKIVPQSITKVVVPRNPDFSDLPMTSGQTIAEAMTPTCIVKINHCQNAATFMGSDLYKKLLNHDSGQCRDKVKDLLLGCRSDETIPFKVQLGHYIGNSLESISYNFDPNHNTAGSKITLSGSKLVYINLTTGARSTQGGNNKESVKFLTTEFSKLMVTVDNLTSGNGPQWRQRYINSFLATPLSFSAPEGRVFTMGQVIDSIESDLNQLVGSGIDLQKLQNFMANYTGIGTNLALIGRAEATIHSRPELFKNMVAELIARETLFNFSRSVQQTLPKCNVDFGDARRYHPTKDQFIILNSSNSTVTVTHLVDGRIPNTIDSVTVNSSPIDFAVNGGLVGPFTTDVTVQINLKAAAPRTVTSHCTSKVFSVSSYEWTDPGSTKSWEFMNVGTGGSCSEGYRLPTREELNAAIDNGLSDPNVNVDFGSYIFFGILAEGGSYRSKFQGSAGYIAVEPGMNHISRICIQN